MNDFIVVAREFGLPWAMVLTLMGTVAALGNHIIKHTVSTQIHDKIVKEGIDEIKKAENRQLEATQALAGVVDKMLTMLEILLPLIQQSYRNGRGS